MSSATPESFKFEFAANGGSGAPASRLSIHGTDALWFHEPTVAVTERGVIGLFRTTVSAGEQLRLAELTPSQSTRGIRPDMPAVTVRLLHAGRETAVALSPDDRAGEALVAEARRIVDRARQHPLRAIRVDLVQTRPFKVRIENVGVESVRLKLDEQALFVESTPVGTSSWSRLPSAQWKQSVTIAPGARTELALKAKAPSSAPCVVRAILNLTASASSIQGAASSAHVAFGSE